MRVRNWLLTGTSIGMLALSPLSAIGQDAGLVAAYENYIEASSSGDADATAAAEAALLDACAPFGASTIKECVNVVLTGGEPAEAAPVPEAPAAEEAPPEPIQEEQPAPQEATPQESAPQEAAPEEPAPEQPIIEQPAPIEEAPPAIEEPQIEEPAQVPAEPEPALEQPAPEQPAIEEPAPEIPALEQPVPQEPEDIQQPQTEQPAIEEPAPEGEILTEPPAEQVAPVPESARPSPVSPEPAQKPAIDEAPAADGELAPAPGPADELPEPEQMNPPDQLDQTDLSAPGDEPDPATIEERLLNDPTLVDQPAEDISDLPADVDPEEIAPLLDSAKDEVNLIEEGGQGQSETTVPAEPETPPAPPPANDEEAQAALQLEPDEIVSVTEATGEVIEATPTLDVPQNVTIINNVVNNTTNTTNTTTNTTNTTVNNTLVNTTQNIGDSQVIFQIGNQILINNPAQDRDRFVHEDDQVRYERLGRDRIRETIQRPDGSQIVTIRNRNGDILQRSRILPDGREYVLAYFNERYDDDLLEWRDPGLSLPPLRLNIPARDYVLDAEYADVGDVEVFFRQPPVEQVARIYSIDEVKRSARVRDSVRRLEIGNLTFDTAKATISRDQVGSLSTVANAMQTLLQNNPAETFLIEGHTDAVGSDISNLRLSDLRAATVARILTDFYDIPPENLATQGYGERYLKIRTELAERQNRRVTIRRITPLITPVASR